MFTDILRDHITFVYVNIYINNRRHANAHNFQVFAEIVCQENTYIVYVNSMTSYTISTLARVEMLALLHLLTGTKYITTLSDDGYSRKMKLTIRKVASRDFSSYRCVAKNSLGETDGLIRLDGMGTFFS